MNLFKFNYTTTPTILGNGEFINGAKSVMWVERFLDSGEFEIRAPLSSRLREFLPLGTLISHVDTVEVMIVENHEIVDEDGRDPDVVITGRSFDTYLENRIIGANLARGTSAISEYIISADHPLMQVYTMINDHITSTTVDPNDELTNVSAYTFFVTPMEYTGDVRTIDRGTVYERIREVLKVADLGIRTIRKNPFGIGPMGGSGAPSLTQTVFDIYFGLDRTSTVRFSWASGDFDKLEHLFSQKNVKNSAMVVSRYCWKVVDLGPVKYDRRMMLVDASDIDGHLTASPVGGALTALLNKLIVRGRQTLASQQLLTIGSADISNMSQYRYRQDYNLGDLVTLDGNYGDTMTMRVVEYAEIEDENGHSSHPTLSIPGT